MNKSKSLSKLVLLVLEKTVDGCVRFEDFTQHYYRYRYGTPKLKKASLAQALKRLREGGFVELINNQELAFRLTDTGRNKALWEKMKLEDEKWDGKWRLVIWDIPEKRRNARDLLRHQLKQLGFQQLQKSVWASKKNCTAILREYIKKVGIDEWVKVVESDSITI